MSARHADAQHPENISKSKNSESGLHRSVSVKIVVVFLTNSSLSNLRMSFLVVCILWIGGFPLCQLSMN